MVASEKTGIVLFTDDPMVEVAVQHLFRAEHAGFELVAIHRLDMLGREVVSAGVQIVLVDLSSTNGVSRLVSFRKNCPQVKLLCWRGPSQMDAADVLRQNCDGLVSRLASSADLLAALRNLVSVTNTISPRPETREVEIHLTYREGQLITLLGKGYRNKEIAQFLGITAGTVKVYLSTLFKKTGAKDRFELTLLGMKNSLYGLAEISAPVPAPVAARRALSRPVLTSMRLVRSAWDNGAEVAGASR